MVLQFVDRKLANMGREDFDLTFVIITAAAFLSALLCIIVILIQTKCCRKGENGDQKSRTPLIVTSKSAPIAVDTMDIDFIDSKDTKVISSTVQIKSLHNSPIHVFFIFCKESSQKPLSLHNKS
uniref:Uncharacterized protein n=1 Tax=Panagrolaimus sp. JU765 TaxID=591449 RepID=A0AC34PXW5_9BILA